MKSLKEFLKYYLCFQQVLFVVFLALVPTSQAAPPVLLSPPPSTPLETGLRHSLAAFQQGEYAQALRLLQGLPFEANPDPRLLYWLGMCHFKRQEYEAASKAWGRLATAGQGDSFPGVWYFLGQSLYGQLEFRRARDAFRQSAGKGYKLAASHYYIGYTSQILEDYDEALRHYQQVQSQPASEWEMKQPAAFEMAAIQGIKAQQITREQQRRDAIWRIVIPAFQWARDLDKNNPLSLRAQEKIDEWRRKIGVTVPRTRNKSLIPAKAWVVRISQQMRYDSNVINEPDDRILKVTNKESPLSQTSIFGKYEFLLWDWVALTPEAGFDATFHLNRGNREIHSNDNLNLNSALRFRFDHELSARPAAGLGEYEYSWNSRDLQGEKTQVYFSRSHNFIFGERVNLFTVGPTTLKGNIKLSENANPRLSFIGPGFSLGQTWMTLRKYALNAVVSFENQWTNDRFYAQRNYRIQASYSMPNLFWMTNVDAGLSFTLVDTVNQQETRGWEKNINPTLNLTKFIDDASRWSINLNYSFIRNSSRDVESYSYSKHVAGLGLQLTF